MRFRLGISGNQQTADSFGRGFQSLAMLPMLQAQAGEEFQNGELKRAHLASQMASEEAQRAQAQAHAALFGQQAEAERQKIERGGLGETLTTAALMNRLPLPQAQEFRDYATTGQLAGKYDTGGLPGPVMPTPDYANPSGLGGQIMQTLGLLRGGLTVGGKIDDVTNAQGQLQKQEAVRAVTADPTRAPAVGQAYAAIDGKPLVENIGNTGEGFNKFTGQGTTLNQGLRVLYDQGEQAQIGQRRASAASSYASAAHSNALTRKTNQDIDEGRRTSGLTVVTGPNGEVTVVDKVNRTAQPVLGADGRPVVKGTAGGGGKPMTEGQAKANLFGGRMTEADAILREMEDKGVYRPGTIKGATEATLGLVPFMGDKLSDVGGTLTNWTQSTAQQQVDQARRDFINAVLRRESGAVISPAEFINAEKQYFPQPNDDKKTREQKRRARQIATTLMLQEVPEAHRYRLGQVPATSQPAAVPQTGGATGNWDTPAAPAGWAIQRVN